MEEISEVRSLKTKEKQRNDLNTLIRSPSKSFNTISKIISNWEKLRTSPKKIFIKSVTQFSKLLPSLKLLDLLLTVEKILVKFRSKVQSDISAGSNLLLLVFFVVKPEVLRDVRRTICNLWGKGLGHAIFRIKLASTIQGVVKQIIESSISSEKDFQNIEVKFFLNYINTSYLIF